MIWWEKTVEYAFIAWSKLQFNAAPLDGSQEQAGDTLFSDENNRFFLIEFKRKKDTRCIQQELDKFIDSNEAKQRIRNNQNNICHFVVYGDGHIIDKNNNNLGFGLRFNFYINFIENKKECASANSFQNDFSLFKNYALNPTDFFEYIRFFCSLKEGKDLYESSGSPFANILVATTDGTFLSLDELISTSPRLQQALDVSKPNAQPSEPTYTPKPSGPSF